MAAKISKIWTDMVEVKYNGEALPKINTLVETKDSKAVLIVKKIIDEQTLYAVLIDAQNPISIDEEVISHHKSFSVPVGQTSKGHIFDYSGKSLIDSTKKQKYVEMDSTIVKNTNYEFKPEIIETGIKAIDFFIPILKGSKIGIFGGAGVGKTVLMKEIIFNLQKTIEKTASVFIGSGERSREAIELYDDLKASNLMDNSIMFISKMNESSGSRMSIVPIGVTASEYLRDQEKENVLLFIDNIFRFLQAGNEISTTLDKKPSLGGYQATLNSDISAIEDRLFANENGMITSFQTVFLPMDDLSDPSAVAVFNHLSGSLVLSRDVVAKNIFPAFNPLASTSASITPSIIGEEHYQAILEAKKVLQRYKELEDVILILGIEELDEESRTTVQKALQLQNFMSQNFFMTEHFTHEKGAFVPLKETVRSVRRILDGEFIHVNPNKFLYIASVEDLITKTK
ncbi:MSC_0618 family F1-like ATPase beta subunit [Mycoplasma sp. Ms02]|uniref:MSC_0618 family F1-like ATPase beta subunit n=1 Tax=Mycoplasma sp. Ms02 TaxID=353851 RepID=UPI001C8986B3|nr:F0F1 ATP synthase subunit beta [Mycoplasma sp. Ms02]QZE12328.1 F0F1 ATP synthase subunit beta [Mycoplasma sp. Ms02]